MALDLIAGKIAALQDWQKRAGEYVIDAARDFEPEIIDANTAQLYGGKEATGEEVTPPYRPLTVQIKREKGQPTDRVTLKDTGDFYASFRVRFDREYFAIYAVDDKAEKLERKYGADIYGLDEENLQELIESLREPVQERFTKQV